MADLRNASTVILLRDGIQGVEVFMMRRHIKSNFVGGAYVFPGGVVDPEDQVDESLCAGKTDFEASASLEVPSGGLAYWIAAIRECFEEAGVLLAYDVEGKLLDFAAGDIRNRFEAHRFALNSGRTTLEEIARAERLTFATDRVHYWAHWITPEGEPRRYDTRFFLSVVPEGQIAAHDGRELTDSAWVRPEDALSLARSKEWTIIFPTLKNLILLCGYESAGAVEAAAGKRSGIATILPRLAREKHGFRILVPGDQGYDEAEGGGDATAAANFADPGNEPGSDWENS